MSVDGTYNVEVDTPMGKMEQKFTLKTEGNVLTGKVESQMGSFDVNGKAEGDQFSWENDLESPMGTMHITVTGKVVGNDISGEIKTGDFGTSSFKGKRV